LDIYGSARLMLEPGVASAKAENKPEPPKHYLDLTLARCERDAEVGNAAAILDEALRALWRGGRRVAEVELRVAILRVMEFFLVRGVAYDVLVGQGVKPVLLVRVGSGDGLDDLAAVGKVEVGVRDDGEGGTGREGARDGDALSGGVNLRGDPKGVVDLFVPESSCRNARRWDGDR
jgi:hypothetical protein